MHNRMPSRRRQDAARKGPQGTPPPAQGNVQQRAPGAPHERDESADGQVASEPSGQRVAREDVERGVVDTDKGPVLDQTYEKLREGPADPEGKLSP